MEASPTVAASLGSKRSSNPNFFVPLARSNSAYPGQRHVSAIGEMDMPAYPLGDAGAKLMFRSGQALFANVTGEWSNQSRSYAATAGYRGV